MKHCRVVTKDGKEHTGILWTWHPDENRMSILDGGEIVFSFDEIESATTYNVHISINQVGDVDELERARKYMADGREHGWFKKEMPKFNWER
jgi:hypothetical protein